MGESVVDRDRGARAGAGVAPVPVEPERLAHPSPLEVATYFLRLGTTGFGGPIALTARMQREWVEERRWASRQEYVEGLALAQLAPGPLAAQLAIYLGWLRGGAGVATLAGVAFVLPSFLMVLGIAVVYVRLGRMPWIQGVFYGIGAAVIALIARGALKLSRTTLHRDGLLWGVCALNAATTILTARELAWVFFASGVLVIAARRAWLPGQVVLPALMPFVSLASGLHGPVDGATLFGIATFFTSAGAFVFGSGLAIVPFLQGGVVAEHQWLTQSQFMDAVAVAMITPGPVVITVAFIGYLVAGFAGATVAAAGVFVPCYLVVLTLAPFYRRLGSNRMLSAFVAGVTAASCGALIGAVVVLGRRAIHDPVSAGIFVLTCGVLLRFRRAPEPLVLAAAGIAGLAVNTLRA